MDNAFGGVRVVQGAPGEVKVVLRKVVFRRSEEEAGTFAGRIRLERRLEGGALRIGTNRREVEASQEGHRIGFETHLEVALPPGTRLKVQNEHGATEVSTSQRRTWWAPSGDPVERGRRNASELHTATDGADVKGRADLERAHGEFEIRHVKAARPWPSSMATSPRTRSAASS